MRTGQGLRLIGVLHLSEAPHVGWPIPVREISRGDPAGRLFAHAACGHSKV